MQGIMKKTPGPDNNVIYNEENIFDGDIFDDIYDDGSDEENIFDDDIYGDIFDDIYNNVIYNEENI